MESSPPTKTGSQARSTTGSSEACMLAGLALKRRWQHARKAAGKPVDRPNIVARSLDEYVAVITCARSQPETRSGREAGVVHEGVPCSPSSNRVRPTTSPQAQPRDRGHSIGVS
jgi:hypothetical protein